jgi:dihydropyrimidinase
MSVIWDAGVNTGKLTPNEFVRVTSTNCAQIFNLYPRKGAVAVGSDADLVVWDPAATKTITTAGSISRVGYNVFEGRTVTGLATVTLSQGNIVWMDGELRTVRGAGRYIPRPAFAPVFDALKRQASLHMPHAVERAA